MPGRLDLKQLEQLIKKGEVDTGSRCSPIRRPADGQARRGSYFLDHVADDGVHACIYLSPSTWRWSRSRLQADVVERGYGDMKMVPDPATIG